MRTDRHARRTDLFLVRVWTQDLGEGGGAAEWHGKVQRVVNGESRQFDNWQALVETLLAMLPSPTESRPRVPQPGTDGHTDTEGANNEPNTL